jgi:hypothetical protein
MKKNDAPKEVGGTAAFSFESGNLIITNVYVLEGLRHESSVTIKKKEVLGLVKYLIKNL